MKANICFVLIYIKNYRFLLCFIFLGTTLSVDQFLQKLPASVIKDGKIIDVRSSISDIVQVFVSFFYYNFDMKHHS